METEAGGASTRKRKSEALEAGAPDPRPRATERSAVHDNDPPPGVDEDGGGGAADRISDLPDAVLGEIISLLPTNDGVRTQVLASRWRHLWRSAPLNLYFGDLAAYESPVFEVRAAIISRILFSHPGPGRRFGVDAYILSVPAATLDAWLRSPALDNLQELDLCCQEPVEPPVSTFRFSATLRVATIVRCNLSEGIVQGLHFPLLKQLGLHAVSISNCSLLSMIASCPALECLLIKYCIGLSCLRINSLSLRSIGVAAGSEGEEKLEELVIESAPCLERLFHLGFSDVLYVSVLSAPKLETLGYTTFTSLVFGSTLNQGLRVDKPTAVVHTVKFLAIDWCDLSLDMVIEFMRCFPCLEKLYIGFFASSASGETNSWRRKHRKLIKCLDIRLKTIVFGSYLGNKSQVNFITFFVLNARVLELMTLVVGTRWYCTEEFLAEQRMKLQLENKASRYARFNFTTDRCSDICHVRDLDLIDPFAHR